MKFQNDTRLKDEVLDKFLERAKEFELAAGKPEPIVEERNSPTKTKTNSDAVKELNSPHNALRYYTVTDFKRFISLTKKSVDKPLSAVRSS